MDKKAIKENIKHKIETINAQISELKLKKANDFESNKDTRQIIKDLEVMRDHIVHEYNDIIYESEGGKKKDITEMEKNIFNSIKSFNNAFTNAGSIFKTH
jgi:hypothetical protein